jgi:hypothetical protein
VANVNAGAQYLASGSDAEVTPVLLEQFLLVSIILRYLIFLWPLYAEVYYKDTSFVCDKV